MFTHQRSCMLCLGSAVVLVLTLLAPVTARAEEEVVALAPAGPSWDEMSGYGSVEASRAEISALVAAVPVPSWDQTSGYGAVEASRATIGNPGASPTQVPADVRWAPAGTSTAGSASEASHAVRPGDLPAVLARGTRAESPTLWAILFPEDAGRATSEDRVANALFGDESRGSGSVDVTAPNARPSADASSITPIGLHAMARSGVAVPARS